MPGLIETFKHAGFTCHIYYDDAPENPREWAEPGSSAWIDGAENWRHYHEPPVGPDNPPDRWDDVSNDVRERYLRMSGAAWHWTDVGDRSDYLPVYFVMPRAAIVREYGNDSQESRAKALGLCKAEAKTYRAWANGEICGYAVEDENGHTIDSVWGFYGDEAWGEARAAAEWARAAADKRHERFLTALAGRAR